MRLVLDTSVLVAAFRSPLGASARLLELVVERRILMVATAALFMEYEAVLKRPGQIEAHGHTVEDIDRLLLLLAGFTDKTEIHYQWRPQLSDPDDEFVLEAAISGNAQAIVTHNRRDLLPAARDFGIQVATPGIILKQRFDHE